MAFSVPPLPYGYDALEPTIDETTMRLHHDKHHQAYVDNANKALEGTELAEDLVPLVHVPLVQLVVRLDRLARDAVELQQGRLELPRRDLVSVEGKLGQRRLLSDGRGRRSITTRRGAEPDSLSRS